MPTTWDGRPISDEPPFGAAVVVVRRGPTGLECLLLHRSHHGSDYAGDWAWTPPSGARLPGEPIDTCAARELREETGLSLPLKATDSGSADWAVYVAEAPHNVSVVLDAEHDRFEWVAANQASARCLPEPVGRSLAAAVRPGRASER
jgi:8-oxo-dGTP pyrophosphatase MutT (NUDIX family)